jgi:hypothetical protein
MRHPAVAALERQVEALSGSAIVVGVNAMPSATTVTGSGGTAAQPAKSTARTSAATAGT